MLFVTVCKEEKEPHRLFPITTPFSIIRKRNRLVTRHGRPARLPIIYDYGKSEGWEDNQGASGDEYSVRNTIRTASRTGHGPFTFRWQTRIRAIFVPL